MTTSPAIPRSAMHTPGAMAVLRGASKDMPLGLVRFGESTSESPGGLKFGTAEAIAIGALSPVDLLSHWPGSSADLVGWLGYITYELGRELEPKTCGRAHADDRRWPWSGWARLSEHTEAIAAAEPRTYSLGPFKSKTGKAGYCDAVSRAIEYIRAGDIYQVNLAHRLSASFAGSARELAAQLFEICDPRYGSYLEFDDAVTGIRRVIISLSPELFLQVERDTRMVTTCPMKGTRSIAAGTEELEKSAKDQAELAMIVDLMRNDLGRVCEIGSVQVDQARQIEAHGTGADGVLQATATIRGKLRADLGLRELLQASFPGGSITGTPKIRAMQIIDELEPVARGPYCGSMGFIDTRESGGKATFNIAIRTLCITGTGPSPGVFNSATIDYSVGAGIVADSDPVSEWRETLDKAWMLKKVSTIEDEP